MHLPRQALVLLVQIPGGIIYEALDLLPQLGPDRAQSPAIIHQFFISQPVVFCLEIHLVLLDMWRPVQGLPVGRSTWSMVDAAHACIQKELWAEVIGLHLGEVIGVYGDHTRPLLRYLLSSAFGQLLLLWRFLLPFGAAGLQIQSLLLDQLPDVLLHAAGTHLVALVHIRLKFK